MNRLASEHDLQSPDIGVVASRIPRAIEKHGEVFFHGLRPETVLRRRNLGRQGGGSAQIMILQRSHDQEIHPWQATEVTGSH